ncbi:MAG: hypothetical protein OQK11_02460, partial [Thiovulaceae bacterium]|nr:hypothetical protein [Sulfurimonadaceae bacterium]
MRKYRQVFDYIPSIIQDISDGNSLTIPEYADKYELPESTLRKHISEIQDRFYKHEFKFSKSDNRWISTKPRFLNEMILQPHEAMILNQILKNEHMCGKNMK